MRKYLEHIAAIAIIAACLSACFSYQTDTEIKGEIVKRERTSFYPQWAAPASLEKEKE